MKTVGIYTLGCKVNTYESEFIINELKNAGYIIKDFNETCDVYIVNTCTVTNNSDSKSKKIIRQAIRKNKDACVVAMGCYIASNMDHYEEGIDIVLGNKDKNKIVSLLDEYFKNKNKIVDLYDKRLDKFEDMYINNFPGRTRAFIKIQDGCDNFCSYCIIPYVRGKCRSKEEEKVIKEATDLANNGYKEIVLTGIHTGNYGADLDTSFNDLLEKLIKIDKLERIRISSIEITELNRDVLETINKSSKIANHLHIPLQSGCDEVLKKMNRKYNVLNFENIIKSIRNIRKDISISTDVIVGFPGETEKMFEETIATCKRIGFSKIHVFPYSDRKGTKASAMSDKIDNKIKKDRARKLIEVSKELEIKYMEKFIDKEIEVLIEETHNGSSLGHTSNFIHVKINDTLKENKTYKVELKRIEYPYMIGELK